MNTMLKIKIIIITAVIFPLLSLNSSFNIVFFSNSDNIYNSSSYLEYYTTSPIEYFNETKHPRYGLATKPIDKIISPNKGNPVIIEYNKNFTVIINSSYLPNDWELSIINSENEIELEILDYYSSEIGWVLIVQPLSNIIGLYDLQFNGSNAENDYQTHSVKIIEKKEYPYKFLHLSDSHFPCFGEINTTDLILKYIETIKNQDLDFVIFTGDIIEGGPAWLFINSEDDMPLAAEVQLKLGLWILDLLDLPVYMIAGNHDLDSTPILSDNPREIWEKYLGENPVIKFRYLDWMYVGFSVTENGLSSVEYNSVKDLLGKAHWNNIPSVLFYHYNYANHASNLRKLYSIEIMLYGHEHDERLYFKDQTLYHCEAPMYENSSSIFIVLNRTSVSLEDSIYDFSFLLQETVESKYSTILNLILIPVSILYLNQKRRNYKC